MKENIVIGVVSRSRPMGTTFQWIKKSKVPIYVYVHEPEKTLYEEQLPESFNIITHNFDTIGKIRNYVHEHQAGLNNNVLILDDDILGIWNINRTFMVSINEVIDAVTKMDADVILFHWNEDGMFPVSALCGAYVMKTNMTHIKMNEGKYENEDVDGFLQFVLADAKIERALFIIKHEMATLDSHFNNIWKSLAAVNMYKKYGDIVTLKRNPSGLFLWFTIDLETAKKRRKNIQYKAEMNLVIEDFIEFVSEYYKGVDGKYINFLLPELKRIYDGLSKTKEENNG